MQILAETEFHVAPLGNRHRVAQRLGKFAEQLQHFLARLHVELVGPVAQALRVAHDRAHLHAQHDVVSFGMLLLEIVHVVRDDHLEPGLAGDLDQTAVRDLLFLEPVVLQFDEKVFRTEDVGKGAGQLHGQLHVAAHDRLGDFALEARRGSDQSFAVEAKRLHIDARFVIKPLEVTERNQFDEVEIPLVVFRQQDLVVGLGTGALLHPALVHAPVRHVGLATDDRFDARLLRFFVEINRAVHHTVIGQGQRGHAEFGGALDGFIDAVGPVQQAELAVEVQMDKWNIRV